jgi:hypothetical protein
MTRGMRRHFYGNIQRLSNLGLGFSGGNQLQKR